MKSELPRRKTPVHRPVFGAFNHPPIIFLTVCADKRKSLFARKEAHKSIVAAKQEADTWTVGRYVLMPDHIHLFCAPGYRECPPLTRWVQYWKSRTSKHWPWPEEKPIWQKSFWDTQLRSGESYAEKWEYVQHNPVRAGLCEVPDDWPYQGEVNLLPW